MARVKLTEHKAKQLLFQELGKPYSGISARCDEKGILHFSSPLSSLSSKQKYVVKVDQGVKGRMKKGLVQLHVTSRQLESSIKKIAKKGYSCFIIEEMVPHEESEERYLSFERVRQGILARYAQKGGIEIESMKEEIQTVIITEKAEENVKIAQKVGVNMTFIEKCIAFFEKNYVSFMEINPLVVQRPETNVHILDLAVEVDSTAQFFVARSSSQSEGGWQVTDIVGDQHSTPEELVVKQLNDNSQAALSFTVLNPDGAIWVLLSGGGASITLADEIYNLGYGKQLGNYGEYSGNPTAEETYLYTKEVLKALFKSPFEDHQGKPRKKVILIGGGVANFTDVRVTFKGVVQAFEEEKDKMSKHNTMVYVRRGGPKQEEGLRMMSDWLKKNDMYGLVAGPELPLQEIVRKAVQELPI